MQSPNLPYVSIPQHYPQEYTAATVTARLLDGLGYRYYWATEKLREEDLRYSTHETSWNSLEIIRHIYVLAEMVDGSIKGKVNVRPTADNDFEFEKLRNETLHMIKASADVLREASSDDLANFEIKYLRGYKESSFPFWHQFNGPIADALTHVGQVVIMRRASGNPIDPMVNVFMGKNKST